MTQQALRDLVELQRSYCHVTSPLYGDVLAAVLADLDAGGPCLDLLLPHADDSFGSALVLRLLGSVHRLVLDGRAPDLAAFYPSAGGEPGPGVGPAFVATVGDFRPELEVDIELGVQTNEVGRAAVLAGGYLMAARMGLPLRILEVGASAGLNLLWDHYRYESAGWAFGPGDSPVRFTDVWATPMPALADACEVDERLGCDPSPIDVTDPAGVTFLRSWIWPDQVDRRARLDAALSIAAADPPTVMAVSAPSFLREELVDLVPGIATVVSHSIMFQYLERGEQRAMVDAIAEAGARADRQSPLFWIRMEPGGSQAELRLTAWPGNQEVLVATSTFHGPPLRYVANPSR